MDEMKSYEYPTRVILHFAEDELLAKQYGQRLIYYQAEIDPDKIVKDFIRMDQESSEVHGWVRIDSIRVDLDLEEWIEEEWKKVA